MEFVSVIFAVLVLVAWYFIAKMDNIIGLVFRGLWNFSFKIMSFIPLLGWLSHFVITMNDEDEERKRHFQKEAAKVREEVAQQITEDIQADIEREEAKKEEQEVMEKEKQEWIKKQAWKDTGRTDIEFSRDGKRWKYSNESWENSRSV